jgi:hypothetical protein
LFASVGILALVGCGAGGSPDFASKEAAIMAPSDMAMEAAPMPAPPPPPSGEAAGNTQDDTTDPAAAGLFLAYTHARGIEVPANRVEALMKQHVEACNAAGPRVCLVVGANAYSYGEDNVSARLDLRANPTWLKSFLAGLEGDASKAGGKIKSSNTLTEDLTRQIVDTEATLRAQKTLRDRLQDLLSDRPGKLGDLLEIERELARVQGGIDSYESTLVVMRQRVETSALGIEYSSAPTPFTESAWGPLTDALNNFGLNMAAALGSIVTFFAVFAPWVLVLALVGWLALLAFKRLRGKKAT